jgi:hypothetical protein
MDVPLSRLVVSYVKAANRFMTGGDRPFYLNIRSFRLLRDPESSEPDPFDDPVNAADVHSTLAEAVRSARAVDVRVKRETDDPEWWREYPDGEKVPALVYVRDAMEYQGADPVGLPPEPRWNRSMIEELTWLPLTESRRGGKVRYGVTEYGEQLVGENMVLSLLEVMVVFTKALRDLVERGVIEDSELGAQQ